jgi:hypothetical protein
MLIEILKLLLIELVLTVDYLNNKLLPPSFCLRQDIMSIEKNSFGNEKNPDEDFVIN